MLNIDIIPTKVRKVCILLQEICFKYFVLRDLCIPLPLARNMTIVISNVSNLLRINFG